MFQKIFCNHNWDIIKEGNVLIPSEAEKKQALRSGWSTIQYTFFTHPKKEILMKCDKCGKIKSKFLITN